MKQSFEKEYQDIINNLGELKSITPRKEFRSHVENVLIPSLPHKPSYSFFPMFSLRLAIASIILVLLGGSGMVFAAEHSKPGDILYPVKKAVEQTQLVLTNNPASKALLHIANADKRVDELKEFTTDENTEEINSLSTDYEKNVNSALGEIQKIDNQKENTAKTVEEHLENHTQVLEEIKQTVPTTAQPAIQKAIDASQKGQQKVEQSIQQNNFTNNPSSSVSSIPTPNNSPRNKDNNNKNAPQLPSQAVQNQNSNTNKGPTIAAQHNGK